jgi:flagellar FliL protein
MADEAAGAASQAEPAPATAAAAGAPAAATRAGARRRAALWLGGASALGLVAGGALWWVQGARRAPHDAAAASAPTPAAAAQALGVRDGIDFNRELGIELPAVGADDAKPPASADAAGGEHLGKMFPLEPFIVNIVDRERDRFLKLKTEIELADPAVSAELEQRLPQIRDLIIGLLGSKSFEDVRTIEGKNFLREEMLLRINSLLVTGKARRVYFTEFVVQ